MGEVVAPPRWLSDSPIQSAGDDRLGFTSPAFRLADRLMMAHPGHSGEGRRGLRSLTVSLEGPWGSGKSSFTNLVLSRMTLADCDDGDDCDERWRQAPLRIDFNVWQSGAEGLSPWAALVYRIGEKLYTSFHEECLQNSSKKHRVQLGHPEREGKSLDILPHKAKLTDRRLHWLEVAHRLSAAVSKEDWDRSMNLFADAPSKVPGRHFDWRTGGELLVDLGGGTLSVAAGKPENAVKSVTSAIKALLGGGVIKGPTWGVDTLEFVADLNRLLRILRPKATGWRLILVVDDVNRLGEDDLPKVLEALGYIRALEDVLLILNLDHVLPEPRRGRPSPSAEDRADGGAETSPGPEVVPAPEGETGPTEKEPEPTDQRGESFVSRLVSYRVSLPLPMQAENAGLIRRFLEEEDMGLGLPPGAATSMAVRHLTERGRLQTPRQLKHALVWLWFRLPEARQISAYGSVARKKQRLKFLLDLYLFAESRIGGATVLEEVSKNRDLLLDFEASPWDQRDWIDAHQNSFLIWQDLPEAKQLIAALRQLSLALYCDRTSLSGYRDEAREAWVAWRLRIADFFDLPQVIASGSPQRVFEHLRERVMSMGEFALSLLWLVSQLNSVPRYFHILEDTPKDLPSRMQIWYDLDNVVMLAMDQTIDNQNRALAWVLLIFIDPTYAKQSIAFLEGASEVCALVPSRALKGLDSLAMTHRSLVTKHIPPRHEVL